MGRIIGSVVNGEFREGSKVNTNPNEHSLHRQYVKDRMREDFARDIVQPFKGKEVNQEFIEAYGKDDPYVQELVNG